MKSKVKQIITIDSQSDIDSSSSNSGMQIEINHTEGNMKSPQLQQDMYQKFAGSNYYMLTDSLKKYANQISDFLEQIKKNVLFVFGPSGCGKGSLVRKILDHNCILSDKLEEYEDQDGRTVPLRDVILESLTKMNSQRVYVCYDFPITVEKWNMNDIRQFKAKFSQQIKKTITKTIYVLNEQIYNSFYVLNERANSQENLNMRDNVSVIKFEKFGVMEMKKILKGFFDHQKLYNYVGLGKDFLEEVVQLSSGDLRKALHMIYWKGVEDKADKILKQQKKKVQIYETEKRRDQSKIKQTKQATQSKRSIIDILLEQDEQQDSPVFANSQPQSRTQNSNSNSISMFSNTLTMRKNKKVKRQPPNAYSQFMKYKSSDQNRCSLYHGLGKLLYGKRLNIRHMPRNKKEISCYYNEREINQLDPPFYFDPVNLFEQLRVEFDIVTKLLQQNYLERYGKIRDVQKMSEIFRMDDSFFTFKNNYEDQEVKEIKIRLVTWGILIYNKNSRTDNMGFKKIEKSQSTNVDRKVREKKRLMYKYFSQSKLSDLLIFAHLTRAITPNSLLNETIFNKAISRQVTTKFDDHTKTMNEQEEQQLQTILKLNTNDIENKLRQNKKQKEKKQKEVLSLFAAMDEEDEDIDQLSDSD